MYSSFHFSNSIFMLPLKEREMILITSSKIFTFTDLEWYHRECLLSTRRFFCTLTEEATSREQRAHPLYPIKYTKGNIILSWH